MVVYCGAEIPSAFGLAWNERPIKVGKCGDLVRGYGRVDTGLSPARWVFWLRRLEKIAIDACRAGKTALVKHVRGVMDDILISVWDTESPVKALDDAGGSVEYIPTMHFVGPPND